MCGRASFHKIRVLPSLVFLDYTMGMWGNHDAQYDNPNLGLIYSMDQYNRMSIVLLRIKNALQGREQLQDEALLTKRQPRVSK